MSSGGGWWESAQLVLMGGERERGAVAPQTLVTCLGSQGTLCPCSPLMIWVGRPWNLLLLLVGPGPISVMHSARSNKSSSEGDTKTFNENMTLLPADDSLDENRDGDREDGEADRQLVEERHSCEEVRSCQASLLLK